MKIKFNRKLRKTSLFLTFFLIILFLYCPALEGMQSWLTSSSNRLITTNWSVSQNLITQVNLTEMKPLLSKLKFGYGSHFKLIQVNQQLLILLFLQANKRALDFRIKNYSIYFVFYFFTIIFLSFSTNQITFTEHS